MKFRKTLALILASVMLLSALPLTVGAAKAEPIPEHFVKGVGPETDGYSIDYRYFSPVKENDTTKYPLVVWLHGMSDGSSDGVQITKTDIKMKLLKLTILGAMAVMAASCCNAPQETKPEVKVVQPGEQAPLADPGQKNFGGSAIIPSKPMDTTGMAERRRGSAHCG